LFTSPAARFEAGKAHLTQDEITTREFAQFIGNESRLRNVEYAPRAESGPIFFYMGKSGFKSEPALLSDATNGKGMTCRENLRGTRS